TDAGRYGAEVARLRVVGEVPRQWQAAARDLVACAGRHRPAVHVVHVRDAVAQRLASTELTGDAVPQERDGDPAQIGAHGRQAEEVGAAGDGLRRLSHGARLE